MKYSPVIYDQIHTNVIAVGLIGVWRTTQLDYVSSNEYVVKEMENEEHPFQPEMQNFCITEISYGK